MDTHFHSVSLWIGDQEHADLCLNVVPYVNPAKDKHVLRINTCPGMGFTVDETTRMTIDRKRYSIALSPVRLVTDAIAVLSETYTEIVLLLSSHSDFVFLRCLISLAFARYPFEWAGIGDLMNLDHIEQHYRVSCELDAPSLTPGAQAEVEKHILTIYDQPFSCIQKAPIGKLGPVLDTFENEVRALTRARHPNIVTMLGYSRKKQLIYLAYVTGSSLDRLVTSPSVTLRPVDFALILYQLILAIEHLHSSCGLVHGDLKPGNVMVTANNHVTLIDFGMCRSEEDARKDRQCGTYVFAAPEALDPAEGWHSKAADIYAFGGVIFQCGTKRMPFQTDAICNWLAAKEHEINADLKKQLEALAPDAERQKTETAEAKLVRHIRVQQLKSQLQTDASAHDEYWRIADVERKQQRLMKQADAKKAFEVRTKMRQEALCGENRGDPNTAFAGNEWYATALNGIIIDCWKSAREERPSALNIAAFLQKMVYLFVR